MALFRRDPPPQPTIVAVAVSASNQDVETKASQGVGWQSEAWRVWHQLGEIHYPTSQEARLISRLDWNTDPEADIAAVFENPGLEEISRQVALNLYVAGEGWLILTDRTADDKVVDLHWRVEAVGIGSRSTQTVLDRAQVKVRFWNPDPTDPGKADSAVRPALGPANELLTLQQLSRTQAKSRLARAGILLRPSSVTPMVDDAGEPVDFPQMLTDSMTSAIADENSAAAVVPIDITWQADEIAAWKHLTFDFPFDDNLDARMERAIRRIALALDIWPELLLGIADVNHWGSWFLAEDTWRGHLAPVSEQVASALEIALEQVNVETNITPDPSVLLARRSTVADALDSAKIGAVGLAYVRETIGANEDDAPTEEDLETIALLLGKTAPEEEEPEVEQSAPNAGNPPAEDEGDEEPAIAAAAGDVRSGLGVEMARIDDQLRSWVEGGADQVVMLARSRVGMQARGRLRGDPRSREIDGVPNGDVSHVLGVQLVSELIDLDNVVRSTVEPFAARWQKRLELAERQIQALVGEIIPPEQWELSRKESAEVLAEDLTEQIIDQLDRTDAELGAVDMRRVVAAAGV